MWRLRGWFTTSKKCAVGRTGRHSSQILWRISAGSRMKRLRVRGGAGETGLWALDLAVYVFFSTKATCLSVQRSSALCLSALSRADRYPLLFYLNSAMQSVRLSMRSSSLFNVASYISPFPLCSFNQVSYDRLHIVPSKCTEPPIPLSS